MITIICIVLGVIVVGILLFEIYGRYAEKKEHDRFKKMSPEERFQYQNEMRKKQL